MEKKKIIWIMGALATTGLVAYGIFHKCDGECFICRHSSLMSGMALAGGFTLGLTYSWLGN